MKRHFLSLLLCLSLFSCQDKIDPEQGQGEPDLTIKDIDAELISGEVRDDAYLWTWPEQDGLAMQVSLYAGDELLSTKTVYGTSYLHKSLSDGMTYSYVFQLTDGASYSEGVTKAYTYEAVPPAPEVLIGFLSVYAGPEQLLANGDDDEASAWLWLAKEYPTAEFLCFSDIESVENLQPYGVLFWLRDLEGVDEAAVWNMPQSSLDALPHITEWYRNGGNLLLWSHAVPYMTNLGRIDGEMLRSNDRVIAAGTGGYNKDIWKFGVELNPGGLFRKDFTSHPIYEGMDYIVVDGVKFINFKGPGWTEDHNCLFYNIPSLLTGLGNQDEECYARITEEFGIWPLGTWDWQIDWVSQLNIWEIRKGDSDFEGTIICIGNGGCEFSMRNPDGTPDVSAYPKNNVYQDNILLLARNSLEYLKKQ